MGNADCGLLIAKRGRKGEKKVNKKERKGLEEWPSEEPASLHCIHMGQSEFERTLQLLRPHPSRSVHLAHRGPCTYQ